jgi:DNA gyrase subunit B
VTSRGVVPTDDNSTNADTINGRGDTSPLRQGRVCRVRATDYDVGEPAMSYSTDDIEVIRGLEIVRRRPEMYVGKPLEDWLIANRLLQEALCLAINDGVGGTCHKVQITLGANGSAEIEDDGPGWSLEKDTRAKTRAELYMTALFACRAAKTDSQMGSKVCSVGLAVLNALSESCVLTIKQEGVEWQQRYVKGIAVTEFEAIGSTSFHGTRLSITLDATILPQREFATDELVAWLHENACMLTT